MRISSLLCLSAFVSFITVGVNAQKSFSENEESLSALFDVTSDEIMGLPIKNTTCITRHCSGKITNCIGDDLCRENMLCASACGKETNSTCTITCSYTYQSEAVNELMECLFTDHECLSLPTPDEINNQTCRYPKDTVAEIDAELIRGDWYAIAGFNSLYDCFDCQILSFNPLDQDLMDYAAFFKMLGADGTTIWPTDEMVGDWGSKPGHVIFDVIEFGLAQHQDFYVMHLDEDTLVFYYCGNSMDQWHFEGLITLSRTTTLNPEKEPVVASILAGLGIEKKEMCQLNPEDACKGHTPSLAQTFLQ